MNVRIASRSTARRHGAPIFLLLVAPVLLACAGPSFGGPPRAQGRNHRQEPIVLHTYETGFAMEVANTIPVSADILAPLLPDGYELAPASTLGLGGDDQGLVVIFNFHGTNNTIDRRRSRQRSSTRIDLLILVNEPPAAGLIDADIPGAFHFYSLAYYTDDAEFAASLRAADMPVEFVPRTTFDADLDEAGEGTISINVPSKESSFYSDNTMFAFAPASPLNGIFWYEGQKGTAALHFQIDEPLQGPALSLIFTESDSPLGLLLDGGGFGPGPDDPATGYPSVITPSLNLFYPHGSRGWLRLIWRPK